MKASVEHKPDQTLRTDPCAHQWLDLGADAVYCWRRQCACCGAIEEQAHALVNAAYTVVGCCAHPYVCEGCGYIPQ